MPLALQAAAPGLSEIGASFLPIVVLLFLSWLLLFRPMMKERREKESMRSELKTGDRVLTIGGLYGTVTKLGDRSIHLRVADGVQVEFARSAIASLVAPPSERE